MEIDYNLIRQIVREEVAAALKPEPTRLRVSLKELAGRLGVSERTVARWVEHRIIPVDKPGGERRLMIKRGERKGQTRRVQGKVLFDVAAVDAALKRWRREAI